MGFWQHLVESYEKNTEALKKSYPLSTTTISNHSNNIAVVVINGEGKFVDCYSIPKVTKATKKKPANLFVAVTIPASEESLKRTSSTISPYPVFEQFGYLEGLTGLRGWKRSYIEKFDKHYDKVRKYVKELNQKERTASKDDKEMLKKRINKWKEYKKVVGKLDHFERKQEAYLAQLEAFSGSQYSTAQIRAVCQYVTKQTIASDLSKIKPKPDSYVLFQVEVDGNPEVKMWESGELFEAWHQYYWDSKSEKGNAEELSLDYLTGTMQPEAKFHPKKISNRSANAKLVSGNDKTNFTFREKFLVSSEAVSIGYEASQKAHQFLRYLINERGILCGEQVIFSYTTGSVESEVSPPIEEKSMWDLAKSISVTTERDAEDQLRAKTGFDYADSFRKSLAGYGMNSASKEHAQTAVIALDAVTDKSGRLSITFYRELARGEYLEKIANWHDQCKWHQQFWDKENEKYVPFIGAPSVDRIIEAVHGKPRGTKDESYTKIKKGTRERLLRCIFDEADIPYDYVRAAVCRASNPLPLIKKMKNGKQTRRDFDTVLSTACALVRRDYQQRKQEVYGMSIELERTDRDYLYGRLLGAADNLEEYALRKKQNDRVVTAALRHMQSFAQRPFSTWNTIHGCLNPYIQQVKYSFGFNEIQSIMQQFEKGDYEKNTPLGGAYLLGYYHERAHINDLVKEHSNKGE